MVCGHFIDNAASGSFTVRSYTFRGSAHSNTKRCDYTNVSIVRSFFFVAALGEELGWSGYAIGPMQVRWGALKASIILGVVLAAFHYVALVQAHRSVAWIAWWTLYIVAGRVIMVWIYNNTEKSVFGMALFHMMINASWQLFPVSGSYFDPRVTGLILATIAVIVVIVAKPQPLVQRLTSR